MPVVPISRKAVPALIAALFSILFGFCCQPIGLFLGSGLGVLAIILARQDQRNLAQWNYPRDATDTVAILLAVLGLLCSLVFFLLGLYLKDHPELLQQILKMAEDARR